ncbi:DNA-3-methyladenine glycosylase I [Coxiella burnetii]|uniref:DNA-3-methyladenine glycosylase I n=1 Tax=Coxiella burnetii TaxID=777 RepID=UPI0021AEFE63|nr:DNA-3-methyladenine glycosylase I [Coxiella burnetii]
MTVIAGDLMNKKKTNIPKERCSWVSNDPLYIHYHDLEWGVPIYDDRLLFEFLILEGMQAGLSWLTILKKRNNYRDSFNNFDASIISKYNPRKIDRLLENAGIIRNKLKIQATINNAKAFLEVKKEWRNFSDYIWHFVDGHPIQNQWKNAKQIPTRSAISDVLSKDLKKRGFKFVGSTICYAFMQAVGMVNDHTTNCFRYEEIKNLPILLSPA